MSRLQRKTPYIVVVIHQHDYVLLGYKSNGNGDGRYCVIEGRVEEGETIKSSAVRHVKEKCGLIIEQEDLTKYGTLDYEAVMRSQPDMHVHAFLITEIHGDVRTGGELDFKWFHVNDLPYSTMDPDDKHWLPTLLKRREFIGHFSFRTNQNEEKL